MSKKTLGRRSTAGNTLTTIDSSGGGGFIAIGTDGLPVVAYDGSVVSPPSILKVAHCGNVTCTAGNTLTTLGAWESLFFGSIAIGTDELPVMSYVFKIPFFATELVVAHCGNVACTAGNTETTIDDDSLGNSIAIGADGLPVMSYSSDALKVAHCGTVTCAAGNTLTTVDSAGGSFSFFHLTSVAIGADGLPVVSYEDDSNRALKVAHCGDPVSCK